MSVLDTCKKKIQQLKEKIAYDQSWQGRYERMKDIDGNVTARRAFQKAVEKEYSGTQLTEEQEAILFSQGFYRITLKNPAGAKFPDFDEYEVIKKDNTYFVKGYCDCTNSYGAQIREDFKYELCKCNGEWACITDLATRYLLHSLFGA